MRTKELPWENLPAKAADLATPDWHLDILCEREDRLKRGEEPVIDWEQAKRETEELRLDSGAAPIRRRPKPQRGLH
jgi:hypothetical protein